MMTIHRGALSRTALAVLAMAPLLLASLTPATALAHCDTMGGPVITDAKQALDSADLTPVLKWIRPEAEPEIRAAFNRTLEVRKGSPAARELADTWFFETLVRVHRTGEGAPYTGLKPEGAVAPGIEAADRALESGSMAPLVAELHAAIAAGVQQRFERAHAAAHEKNASVEAGREYVEAYVQFIHYVERLQEDATHAATEHGGEAGHHDEEG